MSYLNLPALNVGDSTKGTISLWFRVSNDSITKAKQHGENYPYDPLKNTILRGVIPLVTFGRQLTGDIWDFVYKIDCVSGVNPVDGNQAIAGSDHPASPVSSPMEPSHIGLSCWEGAFFGMPLPFGAPPPRVSLKIVLQTPQQATAQGLYNERVECHYSPLGQGGFDLYETIAEASYIRTSWPEAFTIAANFEIALDEWHHVLVSWDLSTSVDTVARGWSGTNPGHSAGENVHGACKFYLSYDDENKDGQDTMGQLAWAYKGRNDVVPDGAFLADFNYIILPPATDGVGVPLVSGNVGTVPQWHWAATPLALGGGHVGAPAGAKYVDNVYHVEMAELQVFVGFQVDTANESIRRAFVDNAGKPVPPKTTEELLGRRPDILLHGSSNWKNGKNTGSVGLTRNPEGEDEIIDSGQFVSVALIRPYTPDPKLGA